MRRYLQGTLDYTCGIYAAINALSLLYKIDLYQARHIFQQTILEIAKNSTVWPAFMGNNTDHYWLVRYMLERWCTGEPFPLHIEQPFASCLLPRQEASGKPTLEETPQVYVGEEDDYMTTGLAAYDPAVAATVWETLCNTLTSGLFEKKHAVLVRFHRFIPRHPFPFVSHWTTLQSYENGTLFMHDASAEEHSIFTIEHNDTIPAFGEKPSIVLVPASVVILTRR